MTAAPTETTPETIQIGNDHLTATISALGAEMQSLKAGGMDLLWHGDPAYWSGRAPILFPIVGRAPGDRIAVNGREAPMAQHGFARRSLFTLAEQDATSCCHVLRANETSRAAYPFDFTLSVSHRLEAAVLRVTVQVVNDSDEVMPFGLGFHPAFLWPLPGQAGKTHYIRLDNGGEPALARLSGGLLSPERQPSPFRAGRLDLAAECFVEDAMIFPEGAGTGLRYGVENGPQLAFRFLNLPNLALWSRPSGAPFLCIEPWHGIAATTDADPEVARRPYSTLLPPGETAVFGYEVEAL